VSAVTEAVKDVEQLQRSCHKLVKQHMNAERPQRERKLSARAIAACN